MQLTFSTQPLEIEISGLPPGPPGPKGDSGQAGPAGPPGPTPGVRAVVSPPAPPADATAAWQTGLNAIDVNRGGEVVGQQSRSQINTGLTSSVQGLWLRGEGMPGLSDSLARGSTQIVAANGITALTLGLVGTHHTRGYAVDRLHILGSGGGTGIRILNAENCILRDVAVSDFTSGDGIVIDGGVFEDGDNAQYAVATNIHIAICEVGIRLLGPANGLRLTNSFLEGSPTGATRAGAALLAEGGDTLRSTNNAYQGWDVCINVRKNAGHRSTADRFENFNTAIRVGSQTRGFRLDGGCFNNGQIGVYIESGAERVTLDPDWFESDVQFPIVVENGAENEVEVRGGWPVDVR